MTREELLTILDKTFEQTKKRQAKWKPASGPGNALALSFPRSSMQIIKHFNSNEGRDEFDLHIYNSFGNRIAAIDYDKYIQSREKLEKLYYMAYTIAFEVDETINDILGGLT